MTPVSGVERFACAGRVLDLTRTQVMGILNVTPDSFSDGGRFVGLDNALRHAEAMVNAGATLVDVGGESTRPGAHKVSDAEELQRVAPVIEAITERLDVVVSVDTSSPSVILEAARLGAGLINDVRALQRAGALQAAAKTGLPVCLMHMRGEPQTMQQLTHYEDLLTEVHGFFRLRIQACEAGGISVDKIVLDPGFGFAKTQEQNLSLFKHLDGLHMLGRPLMVGVSRKSMIGAVLGREANDRLSGSLALAALATTCGVGILRVHDVAETLDVVRMVRAVMAAR